MIRDDIAAAQIAAMKARDKGTVDATRLIQAAIKNRDIELRTAATMPDDDLMVTEVLGKMIKQRRESIDMFQKGGRPELAANEAAEVVVIERFLPTQMTEDEAAAAIDAIATELGATSVKDMGRVMAAVKTAHTGKMDMARASGLVKARLAG
ncbi:GatB/YqeY domain-containing protein [Sphingomonas montana]|uniref:GatB/YqeY domain-containing protein n=1 Tax=Sphingomonas montana TaxID=1843236 RepID=UPI00096ECA73|nr:GatB/YqeY domain-containing protein [Sphingomonas montana]